MTTTETETRTQEACARRRLHRSHRLVEVGVVAALAVPLLANGADASGSNDEAADPVLMWNAIAGDAAVAACIAPVDNPFHESRMYAMTQIAVHDALNSIDRRSRPYAFFRSRLQPDASPEAAVAAAAHDVLVVALADLPNNFDSCVGAAVTLVEEAYDAALAAIPDGAAKTKGIALGRASAAAIVDLRTGDGSDTLFLDFDYPQGTEPGQWRFTPGTSFAIVPEWGEVTPFALRDSSQYRAPRRTG